MSTENLVSLNISKDMVENIVTKQIQSAIVSGLGNKEELMEAMINLALHKKVNSEGNISNYDSDNKYDFMDVLLRKKIQEAAKIAIHEFIKENSEKLKDQLKKELTKPENKTKLIEAFIDGAMDCFSTQWGFNCTVKFKEN